jgi:hypothetical protein
MQSPSLICLFINHIKDNMYFKAYCIYNGISDEEEARWLPETQAER